MGRLAEFYGFQSGVVGQIGALPPRGTNAQNVPVRAHEEIGMKSLIALWMLFGLMLVVATDVHAQRRGVRVDTGAAWSSQISLPSVDCPEAQVGSTLVTRIGHVFSGREDNAHLVSTYCQITLTGDFTGDDLFFNDEVVLGQMVGDNAGDRVSGVRYSFLDAALPFDATGFQWAFFDFPGGSIVAFNGFFDAGTQQNLPIDGRSYIRKGNVRHWDGARDGYDGEYFCFDGTTFVGTWDGTESDSASPCLLIGFRVFRGRFE